MPVEKKFLYIKCQANEWASKQTNNCCNVCEHIALQSNALNSYFYRLYSYNYTTTRIYVWTAGINFLWIKMPANAHTHTHIQKCVLFVFYFMEKKILKKNQAKQKTTLKHA